MTANAFLMSVTMPAINAFVGNRWKSAGARLFNAIYVMNNVGVAVGTTLAGILASISFSLTFFLNGCSTLLFAAFMARFMRRFSREEVDEWTIGLGPSRRASAAMLLRQYRLYALLGIGSLAINLATSAWNSGVAPYLNQMGRPPSAYSVLWTVNGILILVGQPVTGFLNRTVTRSLPSRLTASAVFYGAAYAMMVLAHATYPVLVVGMIVSTLGEMLIAPTIPALVTQATGQHAAFYLGVVGAVGSAGRLIGPVLFGNLFDRAGLAPILWAATVASAAGALAFLWQQRWMRQPATAPAAPAPASDAPRQEM